MMWREDEGDALQIVDVGSCTVVNLVVITNFSYVHGLVW